MPLSFSLASFGQDKARVGEAVYIDLTRRTDPARSPLSWLALRQVLDTFGAPWVLQLWTKDPLGMLRQGEAILSELAAAGTTITAQVTVTGLAGSVWEPLVPRSSASGIPLLARVLGGADHICWRYDPVIPTVHKPEIFQQLAAEIASYGVRRGVINFLAPPGSYKRVDSRLAQKLPDWAAGMPAYDDAWRAGTARELVALAEPYGLHLACCAESSQLAELVPGLGRAACGDAAWFYRLSGKKPAIPPGKGSRPGCGCAPYYDIGSYGHWTHCHRCVYCYAG